MASTSNTNSVVFDNASASAARPTTPGRVLWLGLAIALLAVSWRFAEVDPRILLRPATLAAIWKFLTGLFPPDVSPNFLGTVLRAAIQTIAAAVAGTVLSIMLALPLGILATATLWNRGILISAEVGLLAHRTGAVASRLSRALLGFLRAVRDLVWELLFVAAVGLGPLAGTLALTVAYTGMLGRVYADVFEHVDPQPLEALQSTGATRLQIFLRGVWPQALPHLVAYSLYSFECCMRAAAVLGFVGAGGIGYEISVSIRLFEYGQVLTLLLVFIALLAVMDAGSRYVRAHLVNGRGLGGQIETPEKAAVLTPFRSSSTRFVAPILVLLLLIASSPLAGFTLESLGPAGVATRLVSFVRHMLPPDLSWTFVSSFGIALLQTIAISLIGTLIGLALAVVLAIPATSTLAFLPSHSPGRVRVIDRALRWFLFWSARLVLNILRSIPEFARLLW
jgi:phosphonate transport system permease protein